MEAFSIKELREAVYEVGRASLRLTMQDMRDLLTETDTLTSELTAAKEEIERLREQERATEKERRYWYELTGKANTSLASERKETERLREAERAAFVEVVDSLLADEWTDWNLSDLRQMLTADEPVQEISKRHRANVAYRKAALQERQGEE